MITSTWHLGQCLITITYYNTSSATCAVYEESKTSVRWRRAGKILALSYVIPALNGVRQKRLEHFGALSAPHERESFLACAHHKGECDGSMHYDHDYGYGNCDVYDYDDYDIWE